MPDLIAFSDVPVEGNPLGLIGDIPVPPISTRIILTISEMLSAGGDAQGVLALPAKSVVLFEIESDTACRIRFYATAADQASDFSRSVTIDPAAGIGVLAEFVLSPSILIHTGPPPVLGNDDDPPESVIYYTVENESGVGCTLTATLMVAAIE